MRTPRLRYQVLLSRAPGAEDWIVVKHAGGWFKLPAAAPCDELLQGVIEGWRNPDKRTARGVTLVRVPVTYLTQLIAESDAWRAANGAHGALEAE